MCRIKLSAPFGLLFLSTFLLAFTPLDAQAPAAGTTVAVKMLESVNSSSDPAGKQYPASVTKAVTAANGVAITQGSPATITLTSSGTGYTAQLSSITINGQPVAVTSNSATVSAAAAQYAQSRASSAVGSVLGSLGHHVSTPASVAAAASGQHVFLPTGTTLTFVLGNSPASNQAAPSAPAASVGQPTIASAAPAPNPASRPPAAAAPGQNWYVCEYRILKDPSQPALGSLMYYAVLPSAAPTAGNLTPDWVNYVHQNKITAVGGSTSGVRLGGGCQDVSADPAGRANTMDMLQKQWARDKSDVISTNWNGSPGQSAASGQAAPSAPPAAPPAASAGGYFMSCSTAREGGVDTYYTGIFPIKNARLSPNGYLLSPESQPVLNNFYAYLTQKGYKFKPNSPSACDVARTEAAAQAAQHKRAYEGGGCTTCGKIVETGWKP